MGRRGPDDDSAHPDGNTAVYQDVGSMARVLVGKVAEEPKSDTGRETGGDQESDGGQATEPPRLDDSGTKRSN
jgi:hypothetical protein